MKKTSKHLYSIFLKSLKALNLPEPQQEFRFHKTRFWKSDFCFVEAKLILEIEGGVWSNGRHTRGSGFIKDMEKYNEAEILGYHLLRVTPDQLRNGEAVLLIERFFKELKIWV